MRRTMRSPVTGTTSTSASRPGSAASSGTSACPTPAPTMRMTVRLSSVRKTVWRVAPAAAQARESMTSQDTPTGGSITSRPSSSLQRHARAPAIRAAGRRRAARSDPRAAARNRAAAARGGPDRRERQVERARGHAVEQQRLVELLADLHAHLGPAPAELADDAREDARAGRLERAHADRPRLAGDELIEVGAQGAEPRQQAVGVPQDDLARLGQRDGPRPARALDELEADRALERGDLLGDGRLRVAEALGRAREGVLLRDGLQRGQVARLDSDESISRHDRFQSLICISLIDRTG